MTDDTVSIDLDVPVGVFRLRPLDLIEHFREDWDRLSEEKLRQRGYQPHERFPVFVSEVLTHQLDVTTGLEGFADHVDTGWYDVDLTWGEEQHDRLMWLLDQPDDDDQPRLSLVE